MSETTAPIAPVPTRRRFWLLAGALALLLLAAAGLYYYQSANTPAPIRPSSTTATAQDIEQAWGIRVTQIATTADGGMVDFRYQVTDPDKALRMMEDIANVPILIAENTGTLVNSAALMTTRHDLHAGVVYFMLYRNTNGAVKPGDTVSVVIGNQKLEHVTVQ